MPRNEHRAIPYRPPREHAGDKGAASLILEFVRAYVWPYKWRLMLCILLVTVNACSAYLLGWYTRLVVDDILLVGKPPATENTTPRDVSLRGRAEPSATHAAPGAEPRRGETPSAPPELGAADSETARLGHPQPPTWASRQLFMVFVAYMLTLVLLNFAARASNVLRAKISTLIITHLRRDIHVKIIALSTRFHLTHTPGRLMSRILGDVGMVRDRLMELLIDVTSQVIMFVVGLAIVLVLDWRMAVVVLVAMVPYALVLGPIHVKVREVNREIRHSGSCLWGLVSQKLDAMKAVTAYARQLTERLNFHRLSSCLLRDSLQQQRLSAGMNRTADLIVSITTRCLLAACAYEVIRNRMTVGQMMYINTAVMNLFMPVMGVTMAAIHMSNLLVVLQRISQTFQTSAEVLEAEKTRAFPTARARGLALENVTHRFFPHSPPALADINLEVAPGEWLCVMGPSGSGKTTLLQILARLYDPTEGRVTLDGIPLAEIAFHDIRRNIALVPQEPQILSGTIRDNILYGRRDATPREVMDAAISAEAHPFVMTQPVKYESIIGEKGSTLSGGQRQRLSLARALLANADILLLDDCTSALDAETERKIQAALARLMTPQKSAVIVSQRTSMALRCHRVAVLENGRLTEVGTPDDLLRRGGYFADLHKQQTT
ncbi:MAG: ABC transporter ATP-binding protein/permease [Kiritimatiellaeota bacterium]|nr:ABC transporter ATP-binding protein/permease [Kiritimatiellota bacterium]